MPAFIWTPEQDQRPSLTTAFLLVLGVGLAIVLATLFLRTFSSAKPQGEGGELPVEDISYFDEASAPRDEAEPLSTSALRLIADDGRAAYEYFGEETDRLFRPQRILDSEDLNLTPEQRRTITAEAEKVQERASQLAAQLLDQEAQVDATATRAGSNEEAIRQEVDASSQLYGELRSLVLTSQETIRNTLTKEQIATLAGP